MLDLEGRNLGVMPRDKALGLVRPEDGLDLIEISPKAKPPVVRLMSFDKYRYEREKAEKKERRAQKTAGVKRVQISARAAENDLKIKVHQLEKFLAEGHQVEVYVRLRGRERRNREWASQRLAGFLKMIVMEHKVIAPPKFSGNGLATTLLKK